MSTLVAGLEANNASTGTVEFGALTTSTLVNADPDDVEFTTCDSAELIEGALTVSPL